MLNNMLPGKAGYHFLFSLNGIAKILNYIFEIKYQFFLLTTYLFFFYLLKKMISKNYSLYEIFKSEIYEPKSNIFVISGYFLIFLFIFVSSYAYKEIYIILLLPFIFSFQRKYPNNIFFKNLIRLITPTTDEKRLKLILNNASGFLYYVSVMGITGQKSADLNELKKSVAFIKKHTNLPVVPGFGIKNSTDVNNICKIADGAVVGSSIIKIIEENLTNKEKMLSEIDRFSKDLKNGTRVWIG